MQTVFARIGQRWRLVFLRLCRLRRVDDDKDTPAVADRSSRMVDLGRQPGPVDGQRHAHLQERDAERGRHEPAEVRRQGAGQQVPGRPDLGRAVLRRARIATSISTCGQRKGPSSAHWPPSTERGGRLQWFKSDLTKDAPPRSRRAIFRPTTGFKSCETTVGPFPQARVSLRTLHRLRHRADDPDPSQDPRWARRIHAPEPDQSPVAGRCRDRSGRRRVSASAGSTSCPRPLRESRRKDSPRRRISRRQRRSSPKPRKRRTRTKEKEEDIPPLPAEGDANVRARVDQLLNRPVVVNVEQAPRPRGARPDHGAGPSPVRARRSQLSPRPRSISAQPMDMNGKRSCGPRRARRGPGHHRSQLPRHRSRASSSSPRPPGSPKRPAKRGPSSKAPR